jgi:hypothetical protein
VDHSLLGITLKWDRVQRGNARPPRAKPLRGKPPLLPLGRVVPLPHQSGFRSRASSTCAMSARTVPVRAPRRREARRKRVAAAARATGDGAPGGAL